MIKVNLLPPEYRPKEHTPLPMLAGIIGGVTFTALVLVGFLYLHIQKLGDVNNRLVNREQTRDSLRKEAQKADQLTAQKTELEKLGNAVKQLDLSRVRWARPIDDLSWIIHESDKTLDVKSWIANLRFESAKQGGVPRPGQAPEGGRIDFDVEIAGPEMDRMSTFREQFKKKDRWLGQNLAGLNPPSIDRKEYKDFEPPFSIAAKTQASLKPKELPKPPPAAPVGAGTPAAGGAAAGTQTKQGTK